MINRKDHREHKETVSRRVDPDNCLNWYYSLIEYGMRKFCLFTEFFVSHEPRGMRLVGGFELGDAFVGLGYADYFLDGGLAEAYAAPAVLAEGFHAVEGGAVLEVAAAGL